MTSHTVRSRFLRILSEKLGWCLFELLLALLLSFLSSFSQTEKLNVTYVVEVDELGSSGGVVKKAVVLLGEGLPDGLVVRVESHAVVVSTLLSSGNQGGGVKRRTRATAMSGTSSAAAAWTNARRRGKETWWMVKLVSSTIFSTQFSIIISIK